MNYKITAFLGAFCPLTTTAVSNIATDGSIGTAKPVLSDANNVFKISESWGQRAGNNLFHSFSQFDVSKGEIAEFSGSAEIRNIISRVTGGKTSYIDGTLRSTIPDADFYFLNPAGVVFGSDSVLDVLGTFNVSSADYLKFSDDSLFYVSLSEQSTFTSASPSAFGFLGQNSESIIFQGSKLDAQKFLVAASEVEIGVDTELYADEIYITTVQDSAEVAINNSLQDKSFASGKIHMENAVLQGKQIFLSTGDLEMLGFSKITTWDLADQTNVHIFAKNISLNDNAMISANSGIGGGNITIEAVELTMTNEAALNVTTSGDKAAGNIELTLDVLRMNQDATIRADTNVHSNGTGGKVSLNVGMAVLADEAWIFTGSLGKGDSGEIRITASRLLLSGKSVIATTTFNVGKAGNLLLVVEEELVLSDQAVISGGTEGQGSGGEVVVLLLTDNVKIVDLNNISVESGTSLSFQEIVREGIEFSSVIGLIVDEGLFAGEGTPGQRIIQRLREVRKGQRDLITMSEFAAQCGTSNGEQKRGFYILPLDGLNEALSHLSE